MQINPCGASPDKINDVARGFTDARILYLNTAGTVEGTEAYTTAKAEQDAFGGDVYNAVYNEAAALRAAQDAIEDFNELVEGGDTPADNTDDGDFTEAKRLRDAIVINGFDTDVGTANTVREYGARMVRGYQAIAGYDSATIDLTAAIDGGAFDGNGDLQFVAAQVVPSGSAGDNGVDGSSTVNTLGLISGHLSAAQTALNTAQDALDDMNPLTTPAATYDAARLRVEQLTVIRNHISSELVRLTGVAKSHASAADRSDITDYEGALTTLNRAEQRVRSTATALQQASIAAKAALEDPERYLSQLVTLRGYEKGKADEALAAAGANPSASVTKAAEDAAEALTRAEGQRDAYLALQTETDNPATKLLRRLLEPPLDDGGDPNPADDDGQALVDAISETYGAIADVANLTGEGGAVTVNTANIATNAENISTNATNIATNRADIDTNTANIATNAENIATNATNIATNAENIATNRADIDTNTATLVDHGMKLAQKKQYIENLGMHIGVDPVTGMGTGQGGMSRIDMNEAGIAANRDYIEHNHEHILEHSALIESNQMSIMRNTEDIQTLKSGVAASMALAGMPEMGARGVSVGAGSYGGETALAVGVHFSGENARFKIGVTSSGGETGASLGAGWSF